MRAALADMLVEPIDLSRLDLEVFGETEGEIVDGNLKSSSGRVYGATNGIPHFLTTQDTGQLQTKQAFGYKWRYESSYGWLD